MTKLEEWIRALERGLHGAVQCGLTALVGFHIHGQKSGKKT